MNDLDPLAALDLVRTARADVRERVNRGGVWYDFAYAVIVGAMVGTQALPFPISIVGVAVGISGLGILAQRWAARTGLWVSGVSPKRARWVAIGLGLFMALAMLGLTLAAKHGAGWLGVPVGLVAAIAAFGFSRLWRWVWVREIEDAR